MRRTIAVLTIAVFLLVALAACSQTSFFMSNDGNSIHVVATGGAKDSDSGTMTASDGCGLLITPAVKNGSFHVKAVHNSGEIVFDEDVTGNAEKTIGTDGSFDITISSENADGIIDISTYNRTQKASQDRSQARMQPIAEE